MKRRWRAYHDGALATGTVVELDRDQAHHARSVLRLAVGDTLSVFDGEGAECDASVLTVDKRRVEVKLGEPCDDESPDAKLAITLYQAHCRPERMEWLLQKGCELGVAEFRPFPAVRSDAGRPTDSRLDRWRRILVEAAKQCGRRHVPKLTPCDGLPSTGFQLDPEAEVSLVARLRDLEPAPVTIAVGPESGWDDDELVLDRASIGPRVLRTETAGLVAATLVLGAWGDLV